MSIKNIASSNLIIASLKAKMNFAQPFNLFNKNFRLVLANIVFAILTITTPSHPYAGTLDNNNANKFTQNGRFKYIGNYTLTQTVQPPDGGNQLLGAIISLIDKKSAEINFGKSNQKKELYTGQITLDIIFEGDRLRGTWVATNPLNPKTFTGTRRGNFCTVEDNTDEDDGTSEFICSATEFRGRIINPSSHPQRLELNFVALRDGANTPYPSASAQTNELHNYLPLNTENTANKEAPKIAPLDFSGYPYSGGISILKIGMTRAEILDIFPTLPWTGDFPRMSVQDTKNLFSGVARTDIYLKFDPNTEKTNQLSIHQMFFSEGELDKFVKTMSNSLTKGGQFIAHQANGDLFCSKDYSVWTLIYLTKLFADNVYWRAEISSGRDCTKYQYITESKYADPALLKRKIGEATTKAERRSCITVEEYSTFRTEKPDWALKDPITNKIVVSSGEKIVIDSNHSLKNNCRIPLEVICTTSKARGKLQFLQQMDCESDFLVN